MSQILTAMMQNIKGLWNVTMCCLLNSYRRFKGTQFLRLQRQEDKGFFWSVTLYQSTRRNFNENLHLHTLILYDPY